jgi:hypothetical protein
MPRPTLAQALAATYPDDEDEAGGFQWPEPIKRMYHRQNRKFMIFQRGQRGQFYFYRTWRELQIYAQGRALSSALLNPFD